MGTEGPLSNEEFAKKVMGFFSEKDCQNFKPQVYYNKAGDMIEVMWESADYYGEYINPGLTLYKAQDDNRVVGCEINWISDLMKKSE
jgi:hypothetical protein